jgi:hypothetical protein
MTDVELNIKSTLTRGVNIINFMNLPISISHQIKEAILRLSADILLLNKVPFNIKRLEMNLYS